MQGGGLSSILYNPAIRLSIRVLIELLEVLLLCMCGALIGTILPLYYWNISGGLKLHCWSSILLAWIPFQIDFCVFFYKTFMGHLYFLLDLIGWHYHCRHTLYKHICGPYWILQDVFMFGMFIFPPIPSLQQRLYWKPRFLFLWLLHPWLAPLPGCPVLLILCFSDLKRLC